MNIAIATTIAARREDSSRELSALDDLFSPARTPFNQKFIEVVRDRWQKNEGIRHAPTQRPADVNSYSSDLDSHDYIYTLPTSPTTNMPVLERSGSMRQLEWYSADAYGQPSEDWIPDTEKCC